MEEIKFFKERKPMNYEELSEVAQNVQYMYRQPGEIIFKQGDFGDMFYMVLKGNI